MIELTLELLAKITELVRAGSYADIAALSCGIDAETYKQWCSLADGKTEGIYNQLQESVRRAEAEAEARNVAIIQKAAGENWQASVWWLENRYPIRWGRSKLIKKALKF